MKVFFKSLALALALCPLAAAAQCPVPAPQVTNVHYLSGGDALSIYFPATHSNGSDAYEVQYRPSGSSQWATLAIANPAKQPYVSAVTPIQPAGSYEVRARLTKPCLGAYSGTTAFVLKAPAAEPARPANVRITATGKTSLTLSWEAPSGSVAFEVSRQLDTAGMDAHLTFETIYVGTARSYTFTGLAPSTGYSLSVVALYPDEVRSLAAGASGKTAALVTSDIVDRPVYSASSSWQRKAQVGSEPGAVYPVRLGTSYPAGNYLVYKRYKVGSATGEVFDRRFTK